MTAPQHIYETFIRATPAEVWSAITEPEFTRRYFHHTSFQSDLKPNSPHRYVLADGSNAVDGTIEEITEGKRLVMTWHVLYDSAMAEEPPGRVEWILNPANDNGTVTRVTLRHVDLGMSPLTSANVAIGWSGVLNSMKSLLETGEPLGDLLIEPLPAATPDSLHRRLAAQANGEAWDLLGRETLSTDELDELIERATASGYHWRRAAAPDGPQHARSAWLQARSHTVAGNAELALHHAERCRALTEQAAESADFDHAYAQEALARANALAGKTTEAMRLREVAATAPIEDDEDRAIFESDLADGPWFEIPMPAEGAPER